MGKTYKGKDKAKAKIAKAKAKIARKVKRSGTAIVSVSGISFGVLMLAVMLAGCATSDSAQPAKSQTQNNRFNECVIVVATRASVSNRIVRADGTEDFPAVELFTQTQSLENSGTDSTSQTATHTPTTDVKPDIDVRYNDAIAGATTASRGVLETLMSASANKVLDLMTSKKSGTVAVQKTDGTAAMVECKDGQCSFCEDGECNP